MAEFIEDMAAAYAWADLVICRSGSFNSCEIAARRTYSYFYIHF